MSTLADNYFDLFGIPQSYDIDRQELDKSYRALQQVSHPDRFVNQPTEFQRKAVQQTAYITEAHKTLKSPVLRACYLLQLKDMGFELSTYTVSDIQLLMEQMEYREQLSAIRTGGNLEKLFEFSETVAKLTKQTENRLSELFKQPLSEEPVEIKNLICELQFLNKLDHDLNEVEEQLMLEN